MYFFRAGCYEVALVALVVLAQSSSLGFVQNQETDEKTQLPADEAPSLKISISDEPQFISPASGLPAALAAKKTVQFDNTSFKDVVQWISTNTGFHVVVDEQSMANAGILKSEPINDELNNEPVYLILDRLSTFGISWRWEESVIHLDALSEPVIFTRQYNLGELFDLEYSPEDVTITIQECVAGDSWDVNGGTGSIIMLGDVMFIRQSSQTHRRVAGLLSALKKHGRQTLIFAPAENQPLRKALKTQVSLQLDDAPLSEVVSTLKEMTGADVRLDSKSLAEVGIRDRNPISFKINDQPVDLVLDLLCQPKSMAWKIENGVLWITSDSSIKLVTAVYDVRDLCRTDDESLALHEAILSQSMPDSWIENGGNGAIEFPVPGTMVVSQISEGQDEILKLLENYRIALRNSKPREQANPNPLETHYYRLPSVVAEELKTALPELIEPDSWSNKKSDEAPGTIRVLRSWNGVSEGKGPNDQKMIEEYSVMIIHHRRETHMEIVTLLNHIKSGDGIQNGGLLGGGGGFGGGFFNVSPETSKRD